MPVASNADLPVLNRFAVWIPGTARLHLASVVAASTRSGMITPFTTVGAFYGMRRFHWERLALCGANGF
jgi:hypothetical protein